MKHWLETRQVLSRAARVLRTGGRCALATVVRVRGSAYRHEGAKMLLGADGATVGNVSGGCLEQDVREVARQVIQSGAPQRRGYCSGSDEVEAWDLGLGCDGEVDVFVERLEAERAAELALLEGRTAFAGCSVISGAGASARQRLVVTGERTEGSIGRELDAWAADRARGRLFSGVGGVEESRGHAVFIDVLCPPPQLVMFGAGDDAMPLARSAAEVGFQVVVVDYRRGLLTRERFPGAAQLISSDGGEGLEDAALDRDSFAVVMTHNFAHDQAYVAALLGTDGPDAGRRAARAP